MSRLNSSSLDDRTMALNLAPTYTIDMVSYNVGHITYHEKNADGEWQDISDIYNIDRWRVIMEDILQHNPDVIILHEMIGSSKDFFDTLESLGYKGYEPYIQYSCAEQSRDNWEVIYSRCQVSVCNYIPISRNEGLSCVRCLIDEAETTRSVNIYATTWNPTTLAILEALTSKTGQRLDARINTIVSVSINVMGSYLSPPKYLKDVWTLLGSPRNLGVTLNNAYITPLNERADHIWTCNVDPLDFRLISSNTFSEHKGIYSKFLLRKRWNGESINGSPSMTSRRIIPFNMITPRKIGKLEEPSVPARKCLTLSDIPDSPSINTNVLQPVNQNRKNRNCIIL